MAKKKAATAGSFLVAFNRQLDEAIADGLEEAYTFAELMLEAQGLIDDGTDETEGAGGEDLDTGMAGVDTEPRQQSLPAVGGPVARSADASSDTGLRPQMEDVGGHHGVRRGILGKPTRRVGGVTNG